MSIRVATKSSRQPSSTVSFHQTTGCAYKKFTYSLSYALENLTSEQYTGVVPRSINALTVSRDTLNPLLNTTILKQRLAAIEYYKNLHGARYARWPHYWMSQTAQRLWKYKVNLAVKGAAAYMLYREVQNYRNLNEVSVMSIQQSFAGFGAIGTHAAIFGGLCLII